jgi:Fe-S-cluster containining protein
MLFPWRGKPMKHGMLLDHQVADDGRCQECDGLCCRSFPSVELSWAEFETLRSLGAQRLDFSLTGHHALIIENGCEFLSTGKCTIYDQRPEICRRFFCRDD